MNPHPPSSPTARIVPTAEARVAELSRFLCDGFGLPERNRSSFSPAMMRWKHFVSRGHGAGPRSFVVEENGAFAAHIGVTTTEFIAPGDPAFAVPAVHPLDWLSTQTGGMLGTMLMLKAFGQGRVQYTTGSTDAGNKIVRSCGFEAIAPLLSYYRYFRPTKREVWGLIHGKQPFPKNIVMYLLDRARSALHPGLSRSTPPLVLRRVEEFSGVVTELLHASERQFICTSRSPALLNYLLRAPDNRFSGWMLERDGRPVGFALTSRAERDGVKLGHIVDCFLAESSPALWRAAIAGLTASLKNAGCDVARAICTAPWLETALRENGYFRRGRNSFFLRDPQKLIPRDRPFHITFIDGDLAY